MARPALPVASLVSGNQVKCKENRKVSEKQGKMPGNPEKASKKPGNVSRKPRNVSG